MDKETRQTPETAEDKNLLPAETEEKKAAKKKKNNGKKRSVGNTVVLVALIVLTLALIVVLMLSLFAPHVFDILFRPDPLDTTEPAMIINGFEVTASEYRKALLDQKALYDDLREGFFQMNPNSVPVAMRSVEESLVKKYCLMTWARTEDITVENLDPAEVEARVAEEIEKMGGEEYFEDSLVMNNMTEADFYREIEQQLVITKLQDLVYAEDSRFMNVTPEDRKAFWDEVNMYGMKHILLMRTSDEEEKAEKLALAEDLLQQLRDGADFDELMHTYSEDAGLMLYPDGYFVLPGEMPSIVEQTALSLGQGEISEVVESSNGYHIIMRYDPTQEEMNNSYYLYNTIVNDRVNLFLMGIQSLVEVEYGSYFDEVDLTNIVNPFAARQEKILEEYAEQAAAEDDAA